MLVGITECEDSIKGNSLSLIFPASSFMKKLYSQK